METLYSYSKRVVYLLYVNASSKSLPILSIFTKDVVLHYRTYLLSALCLLCTMQPNRVVGDMKPLGDRNTTHAKVTENDKQHIKPLPHSRFKKIVSLTWEGISKADEKLLTNLIPCKIDYVLLPYQKKESIELINNFFKVKGFAHIQVDLTETLTTEHTTELCFAITKGEKVYLSKLIYQGNKQIATPVLIKQCKGLQSNIKNLQQLFKKLFSWSVMAYGVEDIVRYVRGTPFVEAQVAQTLQILKAYYYTLGFADIVINYKINYVSKNYAEVIFNIQEGNMYRVGDEIVWEGNKICTSQELNKKLGLKVGDVFNQYYIERKLAYTIQDLYASKASYLESFTIIPYKTSPHTVSICIQIKERPQPTIHEIIIEKDLPTNFNIRRLLQKNGLEKNKLLTLKKIKNARHSLVNTGLFIADSIVFDIREEANDRVTIVCNLAVSPPKANYGIETSTDFEAFDGSLYFHLENVHLQRLLQGKKPAIGTKKITISLNQNANDLVEFWKNRWGKFFNHPKRDFQVHFQEVVNPRYTPLRAPTTLALHACKTSHKEDDQSETGYIGQMHIEAKWGEEVEGSTWHTCLGLHSMHVKNINTGADIVYEGMVKHIVLSTEYEVSKTNHSFYPTQGTKLNLALKKSFHLATTATSLPANYWRGLSSYTLYTQPTWLQNSTMKVQIAIGISHQQPKSPMGRFFIGSPDTSFLHSSLDRYYIPIRGYRSQNILIPDSTNVNHSRGSYFFMPTLEWRHALTESQACYALVFIEGVCVGALVQGSTTIYGVATGIGFNTYSPLGKIGMHLGWPLLGKKSLKPKFHFRLGWQL